MVDKLPFLADEHHYAITAVATRSGQLDAHIEMSIAVILQHAGFEKAAQNVLKNMNGDRYVNLLRDLLLDRLPNLAGEIDTAFSEIGRLRTERNEILHWLYGKAEDPAHARSSFFRPFRGYKEKIRTAQQIQDIADQLLKQVLLVSEWMNLAVGLPWPPTSLDKP